MPSNEEIAAHIEKLQSVNNIMHDALCIIMLSTTTDSKHVAYKALGEVDKILEGKKT